jgi:hypothetical protein
VSDRVGAPRTEVVIEVVGVALAVGAVVMAVMRLRDRSLVPMLPTLGVFFILIVTGEMFRVSLPGGRQVAPMATAAALAFAITVDSPHSSTAGYRGALVVAVTAAAMAVGLLTNVFHGRDARLPDLANGLIGIAVASALFREIPVWNGRALLELQVGWPAYFLALAMVVVCALALTVEGFLSAKVRASRSHSPFRQSLEDEFRASVGLTAALSATGAIVAIGERPLGVVAVPLFLFPLVLTQFAVRRQGVVRRTYRQTIRTLSRLTELGGYTEPGHASRVAELSMSMGHELGMSERDMLDLEYSALLHDIGQVSLTEPIPGGATVLAAPADQRRIAHDGAEIVRQTGVLDKVALILEAQTTPYRQVREFDEVLPLASRIIKVSNAYDDLAGERPDHARRDAAIERIHLGLGYEYDPRVVDALIGVLSRDH